MPIEVLRGAEPLSDASLADDARVLVVASDAGELLTDELRRYCRGETAGRSFLIAGHRGIGKTTLVRSAVDRVIHDAAVQVAAPAGGRGDTPRRAPLLRPLFVPLHGPTVLGQYVAATTPKGAAEQAAPVDTQGKPEVIAAADRERALVQLTLALHRVLVAELTRAYRAAARRRIQPHRPPTADDAERLELAAQLEAELFDCPPDPRLREFWARAGVLERGVLERGLGDRAEGDGAAAHDQGLRELVALSTATGMYQRLAGEIVDTRANADTLQLTHERSWTLAPAARDLVAACVAVLTGTAAGAASAPATTPLGTVGVGLAAALGTSLVFKATATSKRERTVSRQRQFKPYSDVATLDRQLPTLIDRVRAAGLAPVFVFDELDKVDADVERRLPQLVGSLKQLLTENAFFCCLTDRSYFEGARHRLAGGGYAKEHTAFSHRVLVAPTPANFHVYLRQILVEPRLVEVAPEATASADPDARAALLAAAAEQNRVPLEERADRAVLPYVLLHRTRLHTYDLDRLLGRYCDAERRVTLARGEVRSPAFGVDVVLQVAMELWLGENAVRTMLGNAPETRSTVHDALYYLSWCRRHGADADVDVGADGEAAFIDYMDRQARSEAPLQSATPTAALPVVDPVERAHLFAVIRSIANALTYDWKAFRGAVVAFNQPGVDALHAAVVDMLAANLPLLVPKPGEADCYRWRVTASAPTPPAVTIGDAVEVRDAIEITAAPEPWVADAAVVDAFAKAVRRISLAPKPAAEVLAQGDRLGGPRPPRPEIDLAMLATQLGVIGSAPAWSAYLSAVARLRDPANAAATYAQRVPDVECVQQYAALLRRSAGAVADAMQCARIVAWIGGIAHSTVALLYGLQTLSSLYHFVDNDSDWVARRLAELRDQLNATNALDDAGVRILPIALGPDAGVDAVGRWTDHVVAATAHAPPAASNLAHLETGGWTSAYERCREYFGELLSVPRLPDLDDVVAAAREAPVSQLLDTDLSRMTLGRWGHALEAALTRDDVPEWLVFVALYAFGFGLEQAEAIARSLATRPLRDEGAFVQGWPRARATPAPYVLFVRQRRRSMIDEWPSTTATMTPVTRPMLPLSPDTVTDAVKSGRLPAPGFGPLAAPGVIAFEMPMPPREFTFIRERVTRGARAASLFEPQYVALFPRERDHTIALGDLRWMIVADLGPRVLEQL